MDTSSLVPAALQFVAELNRAYPDRGTSSDGSVASSDHHNANPTSDHEHGTPTPGDRDIDAVDITDQLVPGDDTASERAMYGDVIPRFQAHKGAQYWIHDDMICFADEDWVPRTYAYAGPGRNQHRKHAHFNWREDSASHNNTTPYGFTGVDMNRTETLDLLRSADGRDAIADAVLERPLDVPKDVKDDKDGKWYVQTYLTSARNNARAALVEAQQCRAEVAELRSMLATVLERLPGAGSQ